MIFLRFENPYYLIRGIDLLKGSGLSIYIERAMMSSSRLQCVYASKNTRLQSSVRLILYDY